jgi:hypothetical protein
MHKRWTITAAALVLVAGLACSAKSRQFTASLTGASVIPTANTTAAGSANFTFSPSDSTMTYELHITNPIDSVFAAHIHFGAAGTNGPVVLPLWAGQQGMGYSGLLASGTVTSKELAGPMAGQALSALADSMARGVLYVNVHTARFPDGEIRGQIRIRTPEMMGKDTTAGK